MPDLPCSGLNQAILDSLSEGVFTVDTDWRITSFNRSAEEITGVPRNEALGQPCSDVLHSTLCERHCPIRQTLADNRPVIDRRCHIVDIDGERIPLSVSAAVLSGEDGEALGGVETFRDLSEVEALRSALQRKDTRFASGNPAMQQVLDLVPVLAASPTSVLIAGETGTGKEIIARALHDNGPRAKRPFVAINCGALPEALLESELFGYRKGAFTGAERDKPGRLALARDGTLFLDEIGEISPAMQIRLLRVLQEREFEPLGGTQPEPLLARIIAASHRDLLALVREGRFREDLYYRLVVMRLDIPSLRERREDIPMLANDLLVRINLRMERNIAGFTAEAMDVLQRQSWPGNIRQLENVIERAAVLCRGELIDLGHLPAEWQLPSCTSASRPLAAQARQQAEVRTILEVLQRNGFSRHKTAAELGMHPSTLYRKLKAWRLLEE